MKSYTIFSDSIFSHCRFTAQNHMNNYPKHLHEKVRRDIAEEYFSHEFRKFFSTVSEKETWEKIDRDIGSWYQEHYNFAPIRDFWNGLHGISRGFKLKNIVSFLTSEHISWTIEEMEIDSFYFMAAFDVFEKIGEKPSVLQVKQFVENLAQNEREFLEKEYQTVYSHPNNVDHYAVMVVERNGKNVILEGNRRVMKALLGSVPKIKVAFGKQVGTPLIFNDWIPTSLLQDLASLNRADAYGKSASTEAIAEVIVGFVQNSTIGQQEFFERAVSIKNEYDKKLMEIVEDKLKTK